MEGFRCNCDMDDMCWNHILYPDNPKYVDAICIKTAEEMPEWFASGLERMSPGTYIDLYGQDEYYGKATAKMLLKYFKVFNRFDIYGISFEDLPLYEAINDISNIFIRDKGNQIGGKYTVEISFSRKNPNHALVINRFMNKFERHIWFVIDDDLKIKLYSAPDGVDTDYLLETYGDSYTHSTFDNIYVYVKSLDEIDVNGLKESILK